MNNSTQKTKYYAVYSDLGFGVFTDEKQLNALTATAKIRKIHIFDNIKYAGLYAMASYNGYQLALNRLSYKTVPEPFEINHLYQVQNEPTV